MVAINVANKAECSGLCVMIVAALLRCINLTSNTVHGAPTEAPTLLPVAVPAVAVGRQGPEAPCQCLFLSDPAEVELCCTEYDHLEDCSLVCLLAGEATAETTAAPTQCDCLFLSDPEEIEQCCINYDFPDECGCSQQTPVPAPTVPLPTASAPVPTPTTSPTNTTTVCFSASSTVEALGKGPIAMKDLQIGDRILTAGNKYETVYAFGHLQRERRSHFLKIFTKSNHTSNSEKRGVLEITAQHLVYLHDKANPIPAALVQIGDWLQGLDGSAREVMDIQYVNKAGLYAPLTRSGTLVVDGILASCYVRLQDHPTTRMTSEYVAWNDQSSMGISHHDLIHKALIPFRILCNNGLSSPSAICQTYSDDGIPYWISSCGIRFAHWADNCSVWFQTILFAIFMILSLALEMLEVVMDAIDCIIFLIIWTFVGAAATVSYFRKTFHPKDEKAIF